MRAVMRARAGRAGGSLVAMLLPLLAILSAVLLAVLLAVFSVVLGGDASAAEEQLKGGPTRSPPGAQVSFVNLQDGATVPTKFSVVFGLERMGVAPAGSDIKDSGHHHLLIDTELPPLDQPIPNDFNHLHFGAGQTEAAITLRPGDHTLQLLLADKDHIPHNPPVMSARIKIHVVSETPPAAPPPSARSLTPSPPGAEVYFVDIQDGATVQRRFRVHFGLRNMGIAPAGSDRENSGHHHLLVDTELPPLDQPIPNDFNHLHFGSGQTETSLTLAPGEHTLQLLLADGDHVPHDPPVMSARIHVRVTDDVAATPKPDPSQAPPPASDPGHAHPPAPTTDSPAPPPSPTPTQESARTPTPPAPLDPAGLPPFSSQRPTPSPGGTQAYSRKPSPRGASARLVGPRNGDRISSPVTLHFGVANMDIRPVGFPTRDSGHYHLLIDRNLPPLDKPMPVDSNHLDFRDGQTLAKITLSPGEHTLQLLLVDDNNMAHDPPVVSAPLKVTVADAVNRDDRNRNDPSRRNLSPGPGQSGSGFPSSGFSQGGPSQYRPPSPPGFSQNGSSQYDPPQDRYNRYQYRPYRYRFHRYGRYRSRYGRGWRNYYYYRR